MNSSLFSVVLFFFYPALLLSLVTVTKEVFLTYLGPSCAYKGLQRVSMKLHQLFEMVPHLFPPPRLLSARAERALLLKRCVLPASPDTV